MSLVFNYVKEIPLEIPKELNAYFRDRDKGRDWETVFLFIATEDNTLICNELVFLVERETVDQLL